MEFTNLHLVLKWGEVGIWRWDSQYSMLNRKARCEPGTATGNAKEEVSDILFLLLP